MSEANRVAVRITEEATLGTTPATPEWEELCITNAPDLAFTPITTESQKLKANRKVSDLPLVGAEAGGSVGHELGFEVLDTILEGALFSRWDNKAVRDNDGGSDTDITDIQTVADTITVVNTGVQGKYSNVKAFAAGMLIQTSGFTNAANNGVFFLTGGSDTTAVTSGAGWSAEVAPPAAATVRAVGFEGGAGDLDLTVTGGGGSDNAMTSTVLDFTTLGLVAGEWLKVGNGVASQSFTGTGLTDGFFARIQSVAANEIVFDRVPTAFAAEASTTETIRVAFGGRIVEGIEEISYSVEQEFGDITNLYQYFEGMVVEQLEFTFDTQAIVGATTTFQGTNAYFKNDGRIAGSTTVIPAAGEVLNTSSNVSRVGEGGSEVGTPNIVQSGGLTINNNLQDQWCRPNRRLRYWCRPFGNHWHLEHDLR